MNGFIKLHRRFVKWEWYEDINCRILFLHCLLRANHEPTLWQGQEIKSGQFITSFNNLAKEVGLTIRQTRTALDKLKMTRELTHETTSHNSIITINNWDKWQSKRHAKSRFDDNRQEIKEIKNNEEVVEEAQEKNLQCNSSLSLNEWFGEYQNVHLTQTQYGQLLSMIANKAFLDEIINDLSSNIARKQPKAPIYDDKYPHMHFVIIKKYWKYRQTHPSKFLTSSAKSKQTSSDREKAREQRIKELERERENG